MQLEKDGFQLLIEDSTAFIEVKEITHLLELREEIDKRIQLGELVALAVTLMEPNPQNHMTREERIQLFDWLNNLEVLSVIVVDHHCNSSLLEILMMFDVRFGGENLKIEIPIDTSHFVYDFKERWQLLIGKEKTRSGEIDGQKLISYWINIDKANTEIKEYINRIMGEKNADQIKSIIKCFNHYKKLGLKADRKLLLEEEAKQFYYLMVKSNMENEGKL